MRETLVQLRDRYGDRLPPLYITENGCAVDDAVSDTRRIAFLEAHLGALHRAIGEGVDVRGYFTWSLTDNVEWTEGASKRFGLVHIDYETLRRTPKESYAWYRDVIRAQRAPAGTVPVGTVPAEQGSPELEFIGQQAAGAAEPAGAETAVRPG